MSSNNKIRLYFKINFKLNFNKLNSIYENNVKIRFYTCMMNVRFKNNNNMVLKSLFWKSSFGTLLVLSIVLYTTITMGSRIWVFYFIGGRGNNSSKCDAYHIHVFFNHSCCCCCWQWGVFFTRVHFVFLRVVPINK